MNEEAFIRKLKEVANNEYYKIHDNYSVVVRETKKDGKAELTCIFNNPCFLFSLEKDDFKYLKVRKCCDGIILEKLNNSDKWNLHIIECKSQVKSSEKWADIKLQFEGGYLRIKALLGILDFDFSKIDTIKFYTAYQKESLSIHRGTTLTTFKKPVGEIKKNQTKIKDWESGQITILNKDFVHERIRLDIENRGNDKVGVKSVNL